MGLCRRKWKLVENCALSFTLSKKGKEYLEADRCPSTTGSSIFLLPCAITWTIFSQGFLARAFMYALLPLRLSFSINLRSAFPFFPNFASVTNSVPRTYRKLCRKEKKKKIIKPDQVFWITAGVCGTVFWVTVLGVSCA